MTTYSIAEAKDRLPAILRAVEQGEPAIITRHGRAIARIVPSDAAPTPDRVRRDAFYAKLRERHARTPPLDVDTVALVRAMRDEGH